MANLSVDHYMAVIDTLILILLMGWSWMDRNNIYLKKDKDEN